MTASKAGTVVFITGAFVGHACWNDWKTHFENKGYTVLVPPWPYKDADPAALRARHPDKKLAALTLPELTAHYVDLLKKLPEKPIVIGHSFGGFLTQLMVNRDLTAAGVAIHSVPPQGVFPLEFSFYKSNTKALGYFSNIEEPYLRSFESWQYAFTNGMSLEDQRRTYDELIIPESKRAVRGALGNDGKVDFAKEHAPLLILAGSDDNCIPASLNRRNFNRYKKNGSVTEFVQKEGRTHFVLGQPTWKEDADSILEWIGRN